MMKLVQRQHHLGLAMLSRYLLTVRLKTHVFQYLGRSNGHQAIELESKAHGNRLSVNQRYERSHKLHHQTSTPECRVSHCLAFAHTPDLADLQQFRILLKFVWIWDDMDKELVRNRCGQCGTFALLKIHNPVPSK
jgi:hypothetical protein